MNKGKTDKNAAKGFASLLIEASCATSIPGFFAVTLDTHPFYNQMPIGRGRDMPFESIVLMDGGTEPSVRGITRLIGWQLTNQCLGGAMPANFLRITSIQAEPDVANKHVFYYEVGVGGELYMAGSCTDYSGGGKVGMQHMEDLFSFLSATYSLPVRREDITFERFNPKSAEMARAVVASAQSLEQRTEQWFARQRSRRHFNVGDKVTWNPNTRSYRPYNIPVSLAWPDATEYEVMDVETVPLRCTCGLGDRAWIVWHPEGRCNLRAVHEAAHMQIVIIVIDGEPRRFSGYNFDTFSLFDRT